MNEPRKTENAWLIAVLVILGVFLLLVASSIIIFKVTGLSKLSLNDISAKVDSFINENLPAENEPSMPSFEADKNENEKSAISNSNSVVIVNGKVITPTPTATPTPTLKAQATTYPLISDTCYKYTINEGEFKSSKCYSQNDYYNLSDYVFAYNSAKDSYEFYKDGVEQFCDGSDFFKSVCQDYKDSQAEAKKDIEKYKNLISQLILKGK